MSGRVLNNLAGFQNRTLTGISSEDNTNDIKINTISMELFKVEHY